MFFPLMRTFAIIIIGTFSGYIFKKIIDKKHQIDPNIKKNISVFLQKIGMLWLLSITFIGSLWIFETESLTKVISLPFVGAASTVIGGFVAVIIAKFANYKNKDVGSIFACGFFSNTVILGGMICFFYLGEEGYALVPIFTFFMRFLYFGIGFPIAHMYGDSSIAGKEMIEKIKEVMIDPFFYVGTGSVLVGLALNLSTLQRPEIYASINEILIPMTTIILLFSVGLTFRFSRISKYIKECLMISFVKFLIVPVIILAISLLIGLQNINNGLPLKVAIIISSMPVAFNSVIAANIYNLNIDMVNSCWLFTTFALLPVLPVILYIVDLF